MRRAYLLPGGQVLSLVVPEQWVESREPARADAPFGITFKPSAGPAFRVMVSVIHQGGRRPDVRAIVERSGRALLVSAVEDRLVLEELLGPEVSWYFFRLRDRKLTDQPPKPDDYKYLVQGAVRVSDLVLTFTVLTNQPNAAAESAALEMLRSAEASPVT